MFHSNNEEGEKKYDELIVWLRRTSKRIVFIVVVSRGLLLGICTQFSHMKFNIFVFLLSYLGTIYLCSGLVVRVLLSLFFGKTEEINLLLFYFVDWNRMAFRLAHTLSGDLPGDLFAQMQ